jgi:purine-nucleoside phosphorylase
MNAVTQILDDAVRFVRTKATTRPLVGVVLGSGLGAWADSLGDAVKIPYAEIPHMPISTVAGHAGNLVIGHSNGVAVACLQGRVHPYEGHPAVRAVFGARLLARLGCRAAVLTNAAGGIREGFKTGDFMMLSDHLNLSGMNPLVGPNEEALGPRFPDMSTAYDPAIRALARDAASELGVGLHEGVYAALLGPSYETPAEIRMLQRLGADAVGMSTALEVIALRHMGVRCGAMSCITNLAAGLSPAALDHAEVEETARRVHEQFKSLLTAWVKRIGGLVANAPSAHGSAR